MKMKRTLSPLFLISYISIEFAYETSDQTALVPYTFSCKVATESVLLRTDLKSVLSILLKTNSKLLKTIRRKQFTQFFDDNLKPRIF